MKKRMTYEQALAKVNKEKPRSKWNFGTTSFNKYHAIKTTYNGSIYDSKLESKHAQNLDFRLKAGLISGWDRQCKIDLYFYDSKGNKVTYKSWKVDFCVHELDGTYTLEEVKGMEGDDYRWKKEILEKVWLKDNLNYKFKVYKSKDI